MRKILNIDAFLSTLLVFFSMLLFPLILSLEFFDPFKKTLADFHVTDVGFVELRQTESIKPDTNMVLVNIKGLKRFELAVLLGRLQEINPKVIALGEVLRKSNNKGLDNLLMAKLNSKNIVLGIYSDQQEKVSKELLDIYYQKTENKTSLGILNIFTDKEKEYYIARDFPPWIMIDEKKHESFALKIIEKYEKEKADILKKRANDKEQIFFTGNLEKFYWVHAKDILEDFESFSYMKGKILLLGEFTTDKTPYEITKGYYTLLNEESVGRTFPDMYSIVLQANIILMILNENYYNSIPSFVAFLIAFFLCYFNMLIFSKINIKYKNWYEISSVLIFLFESIIILFLTVIFFHKYNFELNQTLTIFAIALSVFVFEGYNESVKPLTIKTYNYIFKR